jgi:hypothetical protein
MEYWNTGLLECWQKNFTGCISRLESWNVGMLDGWEKLAPLFHYSTIPSFPYYILSDY